MRFRRHGGSAIAARALSACCWFVLSWRQQLGLDCSTNETVDSSGASCLPACSLRMVLTGGARNRSRSRRPDKTALPVRNATVHCHMPLFFVLRTVPLPTKKTWILAGMWPFPWSRYKPASPTSWQMHLTNLDFWQNHKIHHPTSWQIDLANCQGWQNQPLPAHICAHSSAWHRRFFGRLRLSRARENVSLFPFFPRA